MAKPTEKQKVNKDLSRVVTPIFRVSYPHVFKAQAPNPKDTPKFSITMLFPKTTDLSGVKNAIKQAKIAKWGSKENWPEDLESPVGDGDDAKYEGKEGYVGHWVIKATTSADHKPGVVDENVEPILEQSEFYAGCYARASIFACTWEYMKKEGVMFILDHVQKMDDGKPLGSKKSADQVFAPVGTSKKKKPSDDEDDEEGF